MSERARLASRIRFRVPGISSLSLPQRQRQHQRMRTRDSRETTAAAAGVCVCACVSAWVAGGSRLPSFLAAAPLARPPSTIARQPQRDDRRSMNDTMKQLTAAAFKSKRVRARKPLTCKRRRVSADASVTHITRRTRVSVSASASASVSLSSVLTPCLPLFSPCHVTCSGRRGAPAAL